MLPSYRRLTFRRGLVRSARMAPDGQTFLYGALWDGNPCRVHAGRLDGPESNPLDLPDANVLAISRSGELAVALGAHLEGVIHVRHAGARANHRRHPARAGQRT